MIPITYTLTASITPATRASIMGAHAAIEAALDVEFVEGGADITYLEADTWGTSAAYVGLPSTVWLLPGEDGMWSLHETGHALGLQHPHEVGRPELGMLDSVMSHKWDTWSPELGQWLVPQGLMAWDVAQLVPVYGRSHASDGNDVYRPDPRELSSIIDWQGVDTIDLGRSNGVDVDLAQGWLHHADGGSTWVMDGIERVILSPGVDHVVLSAGDMFSGVSKSDVLIGDGDVHKLTRGEKRELGVSGRWFEADGTYVEWGGKATKLEALIVEDVG